MLLVTFINFVPNHVLVNISKLKLYKFIKFEVQNSKVQTLVYWEKPHITNQSQKGGEDNNDKDENTNDEIVPHQMQMRKDNLVVITIEELADSLT
jgi:hypothetical protein